MNEVSPIFNKQATRSKARIKELFNDILDECERAALLHECCPEAAADLMGLIVNELESFHSDFYDIIITKCINQMRINYSQGKLFDD